MQKTYYPKAEDIQRDWVVVDANDQTLGRLATQISTVMLGKHKPGFTPGVEMGDYVIVVNAGKVAARYGATGMGPSIYLEDPEGNTVELKGPPAPR